MHSDPYFYLDPQLINEYGDNPPSETKSLEAKYPNGLNCKICNELYNFALPNQPDETLICWSCKH